ncbi:MAG: bifunctional protein-serine/threonine kinase/phosphatase [Marinobacterium sp.]|nr:bifunctional protein-serine/threonine kinase/phosphatase [Marinobacterium sp.]
MTSPTHPRQHSLQPGDAQSGEVRFGEVRFGGCSAGGIKALNQDAFAAHQPTGQELHFKGAAAVIADGVSSCTDSHIASQTSVTSFINDYFSTPHSWSVRQSVSRVLHSLNRWLYQHNQPGQDAMLCTFASAIIKSDTLHCFHVGDSRIYLWQQADPTAPGELELLTRDHNRTEGGRNYLSRALGGDNQLKVDYLSRQIQAGDRILLTSDGLHEFIPHNQLCQQLAPTADDDLEQCARALVQQALDNGSNDNVTALIMAVERLPRANLSDSQQRLNQLPIPPALEAGNRIDYYEVQEVIFSGARSHLYRVIDPDSGRTFALKTPSLNFSEDTLYLDGFLREDWVGQRIEHRNVMKTFPPLRPRRFMYYLSEYIEGQTLRQWMHDNPQPSLSEVRALLRQIIQGLRAFQRADMVHQDLKPENIILTHNGEVKIIDFGTVLIAGVEEITSPLARSIPQGSVNYIAPEYLVAPEYRTAPQVNFRADLFSLAVICYEMLTGKLPYRPTSGHKPRLKHYGELHYIPAIHHRPDLPHWLEGCLRKALQPDPALRYNALSEFQQDMEHPNRQLEARIRHQPLLQRDPLKFWQALALLLLLLNLIQLLR